MLKAAITRFLQHITSQNNWSRDHLRGFAGKVVAFDFVIIRINLLILEDGSLSLAGESYKNDTETNKRDAPDATIHVPPSLALRMLAKDDAAKMQIKIDGDSHLATELSKVLQNMRWDIEEDLSKFVGDIAANKIASTSKKAAASAKTQVIGLAEMLSEYWQEEIPMLAKKMHVEKFNADTDNLKSDVALLEKRIAKLSKAVNTSAS
jgi:ubiquinone biosynthesis accessory factor UbiJ